MRKLLSGFCALALLIGIAGGCTDSNSGPVGENPSGGRSPSASPPTAAPPATAPSDSGSAGSSPSSPAAGGTETPKSAPGVPTGR